ncbi:MAG: repressor LexA [Gammaproteobacteria bacterium]|nr:repressor LexA [Gammaproteobacteria bacterium]
MLTQLEEKVLACVTHHIAEHGYAPTLNEIGKALSINSKGTVHRYVQSLIDKGQLQRNGRSWRGIRLTAKAGRSLTILPLLGTIEAGKPIRKIKSQSEINFSALLLGPDRFALKVIGNTMIEAGILDGDIVIVRKTEKANNDDIVVALIDDGEVTLKRLRLHGDRIELIPANRDMVSLIYPTERVHIQGVVTGQFRQY